MNELYNKLLQKDLPILDIGLKEGITGYLDFIKVEDLNENPIMKKIDKYGRKFLSLCLDTLTLDENENKEKSKIVITIFERYSDNNNVIATGTRYDFGLFWPDSIIRGKNEFNLCIDRINKLLSGEIIYNIEELSLDETRTKLECKYGNVKIYMSSIRNKILKTVEDIMYKDIAICVLEYI